MRDVSVASNERGVGLQGKWKTVDRFVSNPGSLVWTMLGRSLMEPIVSVDLPGMRDVKSRGQVPSVVFFFGIWR